MSKREIIDRIKGLNSTADGDFLASFSEAELLDYFHQLQEVERERRECQEHELIYGNS